MSGNDLICTICVNELPFKLVTEDYKPIITEDNKNYIGDIVIIRELRKIDPPKPIWTNQYGSSIVQHGMVLIGGNGLNS
jgi:hypothetical protein